MTSDGWLVVSETEAGDVSVQKSNFSDTLFLELTSILLWGQLKIHFVTAGKSDIAILRFDTVGDGFRVAIGPEQRRHVLAGARMRRNLSSKAEPAKLEGTRRP